MTTDEPIDEAKPLAQFDITGELRFDDHTLRVTSTIQVSRDGTITITTQPVDLTNETVWIFEYVPGRERLAKWARLRATSMTGEQVESDHVVMTGRNDHSGPDGTTIALNGELSRLTVHYNEAPTTAAECRCSYWTVGMKGFGVQHATTPLGTVRLAGHTEITDYDHIAGIIQIIAGDHEQQTFPAWTDACDDAVEHLLLIVALAEGKLLEWSIRETSKEGRVITRTFYGPKHTGTPRDGIFHWLNLQPVLDLAVTKYTQELRDTTGIELAIRLLLAQPLHVELQLISAMTALEHLISVHAKQHPVPGPIPKTTFAAIRARLEAAYDDAIRATGYTDQAASSRVRERIAVRLNETSFKDRLDAMLHDYDVPLCGIRDDIKPAIDARNKIIHTGKDKAEFPEFYGHVAVLRELVKRIILTLLGYQGQYISFLNGQEFLHYPPNDV